MANRILTMKGCGMWGEKYITCVDVRRRAYKTHGPWRTFRYQAFDEEEHNSIMLLSDSELQHIVQVIFHQRIGLSILFGLNLWHQSFKHTFATPT